MVQQFDHTLKFNIRQLQYVENFGSRIICDVMKYQHIIFTLGFLLNYCQALLGYKCFLKI